MTCWMMSGDRFMTYTSLFLTFQLLHPFFQHFVFLSQGFDLAGQLFDGFTLISMPQVSSFSPPLTPPCSNSLDPDDIQRVRRYIQQNAAILG